jgi:hypothetical protein
VSDEYVLNGQAVHAADPGSGLKVPALQATQVSRSAACVYPAVHMRDYQHVCIDTITKWTVMH